MIDYFGFIWVVDYQIKTFLIISWQLICGQLVVPVNGIRGERPSLRRQSLSVWTGCDLTRSRSGSEGRRASHEVNGGQFPGEVHSRREHRPALHQLPSELVVVHGLYCAEDAASRTPRFGHPLVLHWLRGSCNLGSNLRS